MLNAGYSEHDLDLYFIPFSEQGPDPEGLRAYLSTLWGAEYNLGGAAEGEPGVRAEDVDRAYAPEPTWVNGRYTFRPQGKRIDVFIA